MALSWLGKLWNAPARPPKARRMPRPVPLALEMLEDRLVLQARRTWVSGVGDDLNPCSRTAPCKTLAGAISKTAAGGEIDALDPGGFGALTITKAITIDGGAGLASVLATGTNAINIQAGVNDNVIIRNFSFQGLNQTATPGLDGIRITSAGSVTIENCHIQNFGGVGIDVLTNAGFLHLNVDNTTLDNNTSGGLFLQPNGVPAYANVNNVQEEGSTGGGGFFAGSNGILIVNNSSASGNGTFGFQASKTGGATGGFMFLTSDEAIANGTGIKVLDNSPVFISDDTITENTLGLSAGAGGSIMSYHNNRVNSNGTDGAPTATIGLV